MRVKICGITNLDDAAEAVRLGAWAIGLIHYDEEPAGGRAGEAAAIAAAFRRKCEVVGVFVNPELDDVAKAVEDAGLTMVQLNGDEGPQLLRRGRAANGRQGDQGDPRLQRRRRPRGRGLPHRLPPLRPARQAGSGAGPAKSFDWSLLRERRSEVPAIVAGGLRPENVAEAIAVTHPFAVDVASGVEAEPGRKDHAAMAAFFEAANAD